MSSGVALNSRFIMFSAHRRAKSSSHVWQKHRRAYRKLVRRNGKYHRSGKTTRERERERVVSSSISSTLRARRVSPFFFFFFSFLRLFATKKPSPHSLCRQSITPPWSAFLSFLLSHTPRAKITSQGGARIYMDSSIESARWARWARRALRKML